MKREVIEVQLTPQERQLILRYGYPFERIEQALLACSKSKIEVVPLDAFEFKQLIGDLSISINDMRRGRLQEELFDLCDRLEYAERTGDGMLFED